MTSIAETQPKPGDQLELLADETRRRLLVALLTRSATDRPIDITEGVRDSDSRRMIELRHVHLPKLEDSRVIRWDRENKLVERGPQFEAIEPLLTVLHNRADELPGEWL